MPGTQPFTWGIYVGLNTLFLGGFVLVAGVLSIARGDSDPALTVFATLLIGLPFVIAGYYTVRRYRAACVASTIISLNIVWWIANSIYFRNRWHELRAASTEIEPSAAAKQPDDAATVQETSLTNAGVQAGDARAPFPTGRDIPQ